MSARRRAILRLPLAVAGMLTLPLRRRRRARGMSVDADERRDEFLALTAGVTRTIGGARIRTLFRSKGKKAEIRHAALESATKQAVEQLGNMKGLSMKVGQMMSYLNVLSEQGEDELATLQSAVPPMAPDLVRAVIEDQLGAVPERVFAQFDMEPIAAASVGQVHRARLADGRSVAVKVQYPGVHDAFKADLANLEQMTGLAALTTKADIGEYVGVISDSFLGELDYSLEQRNQQRLADMYRDHPFVLIPDTVPDLCRPRVLVSEFIGGDRFQDAVAARSQEERNRLGEIMYRFAFGCVMNGFFSGDPHPGNYLFPADGRVCFLDFGMVMEITAADHADKISQVVAGALRKRQDLIDDGLRDLGFLPDGGPDGAAVWGELEPVIVGPISDDAPVRLDRHTFRRGMQALMNPRSNLNRASMRTERFETWAAIWMRYAVGALAAISKFEPEANWRRIVEEIVLGEPPRTDIGARWGAVPGGAEFVGSRFTDL